MTNPVSEHSGTRGRTRRAIIDAAATVLARDRAATLADIAKAAEVGRSTLHRYFHDRDDLLRALVEDSLHGLERAGTDAHPHEGPPLEAMRRMVASMVEVGERILLLFGDASLLETYGPADAAGDADCADVDDSLLDLIRRGQADGVFDPDVSDAWIQNTVWALVYTGCEMADKGLLPRHGVAQMVMRTLENGIAAPAAAAAPAARPALRVNAGQ
ncbi:TetR/AcrR family transcriptional regulator [Nocardiopsis mangrovi]|uniref:TetR/AcrR family transcriptional regulator n=1 Tax=Nocardiopsis mangrovi TaxID=1179818 RepID=A0ABV9DXC4_9ACTN